MKDTLIRSIVVGGTQFTVLSVIVIVSTFVPRGAFAFNPKELLEDNVPSKQLS